MAGLRQVALARGVVLVRGCEASSANVTSRAWCRAFAPGANGLTVAVTVVDCPNSSQLPLHSADRSG
ncbi:hypothetical protein, partial [Streptantibioticus ferralitis]|uniref:hypothetical protein n=1 Tax=Streptantibioticus ferralitis TaxID=236510 RepID=UPI0031DD4586